MITNIKGCGFFFPFPVPTDEVLCAMKISAMMSRQKGRDFYDVMYLLALSKPAYTFLAKRNGINNLKEFRNMAEKMLQTVNLKKKIKDFDHLIFYRNNSNRILRFKEFLLEMEN